MVYSARRFVLGFAICYFVLVFFSPFASRLPVLGKRDLILVFFVRLFDLLLLSVSSSSSYLERAEACDCGTPWTFLLPCFHYVTLVLLLLVHHLFFFWCLGKALLRDWCISWVSSLSELAAACGLCMHVALWYSTSSNQTGNKFLFAICRLLN